MFKQIGKHNCGFTIIEIIVVLLLISIIAATAFQRSISTDQMHFRSQFDKIQNQMRYPQSIAMKRSEWWGVANDTTHYWIFTGTNKDIVANQRRLPGQEDLKISLAELEISMTPAFTVIFDSYGIPYWGDWNTRLTSEQTVNLTGSGAPPRSFNIVPETGVIR
jgi:prepilin-type N-terminal cleavage/methylation domain-containing protein